MFSSPTRVVLAVAALAYGLWLVAAQEYRGLVLVLVAILLIVGYFRYGTVWLACRALRKGDSSRADRLLSEIRYPEKLSPQNLAYYNLVKGAIAAERGDLNSATQLLDASQRGALRTSNDRSLVSCYLAHLALKRGDRVGAQRHLEQARSQKHRPSVEALINNVQTAFSSEG